MQAECKKQFKILKTEFVHINDEDFLQKMKSDYIRWVGVVKIRLLYMDLLK